MGGGVDPVPLLRQIGEVLRVVGVVVRHGFQVLTRVVNAVGVGVRGPVTAMLVMEMVG
jgi:hypothetical protein